MLGNTYRGNYTDNTGKNVSVTCAAPDLSKAVLLVRAEFGLPTPDPATNVAENVKSLAQIENTRQTIPITVT